MRKWRTVIFINGCFWHGHECENFRPPKSNTQFWENKIETNKKRDQLNIQKLGLLGYRVITIWECELTKKNRDKTLDSLLMTLSQIVLNETNPKVYHIEENDLSIAAETSVSYGLKN